MVLGGLDDADSLACHDYVLQPSAPQDCSSNGSSVVRNVRRIAFLLSSFLNCLFLTFICKLASLKMIDLSFLYTWGNFGIFYVFFHLLIVSKKAHKLMGSKDDFA